MAVDGAYILMFLVICMQQDFSNLDSWINAGIYLGKVTVSPGQYILIHKIYV